jgi:hypothetical protein
MTWLTWRQHRQQALFAALGFVALAALLIPTDLQMHDALGANGLSQCLDTLGPSDGGCHALVDAFSERFKLLRGVAILLLFVPLLVGMFLGPPLVARELENGTHRLVWTQGVTRLRWALVKIGLVGALAVAIAAGYALLVGWWMTPLDRVNTSRLEPGLFDMQGLVPVAYTLFAVGLGIAAGTVTRKVLSAMALTVFVFVSVRLAVDLLARPHFLEPLRRVVPALGGKDPTTSGDWIVSSKVHDASGNLLSGNGITLCPPGQRACLDKFGNSPLTGAYNVVTYQPAGRFWTFQGIETGLFVALTALLIAFAVYRIKRRLT